MQGSVLSTLLYLIYTLDFPLLYHDIQHDSHEDYKCQSPTGITFVDDMSVTVKQQKNKDIQITLKETLSKTSNYMKSNSLAFNNDKTKLIMISRHPDLKKNVKIVTQEEEDIFHSKNVKILGITIQDNLKMNQWIDEGPHSLLKQLRTRNNALKQISKLTDFQHRLTLANALFQSKLVYRIHIWGTTPKYLFFLNTSRAKQHSQNHNWIQISQMEPRITNERYEMDEY